MYSYFSNYISSVYLERKRVFLSDFCFSVKRKREKKGKSMPERLKRKIFWLRNQKCKTWMQKECSLNVNKPTKKWEEYLKQNAFYVLLLAVLFSPFSLLYLISLTSRVILFYKQNKLIILLLPLLSKRLQNKWFKPNKQSAFIGFCFLTTLIQLI